MEWTLPDELQAAPREDRIRWHRDRVAVQLPVFDFLDELDSGEAPWTVRAMLSNVRDEIAEMELEIELREHPDFIQLEASLCRQVNRLVFLRGQLRGTKSDQRKRLRGQVETAEQQVKETEAGICKVCQSVWGTCPFGKDCTRLHTRRTGCPTT